MNIVLADVQSLNVNLAETGTGTELSDGSLGDGEFSNLLAKQLEQDVELSPRVEYPQVIDIKELNLTPEALSELQGAVLSGAEIPSAWLDYLASEQLSVTTDSGQATPIPGLTQTEFTAETEGENLQPGVEASTVGGELPVNGIGLPPVANMINQQSATAVTATLSEGQTLQPEVSVPVNPVLKQLAGQTEADIDSTVGDRQLDPKNPEWSAVLRQSETSLPLKPGLPGEGVAIKNVEFQAIQGSIADVTDVGSNHRLATAGLGLQTTSVTQTTALLPTSLETLTVSNSRDTAAWGSGIGERIQWMINQKLNSATIRLDPPMLGRLDVHIQVSDDVTNVTINTQHAQTRDIIDNASFRLRDYLQENGYQNVNVDVSQQQQQQQASQEPGDEAGQSTGDDVNTQEAVGDIGQTVQYYSSDTVVDYFA